MVSHAWLRSSTRQSSRFLPGRVQVRRLPESPRGRTATGAVSRLENGWAATPWGFDSLSFRLARPRQEHAGTRALEAWPSWQGSALLPRRRLRSRSQVRVLLPPFPGMTAGSSTGRAPLLQGGGWGFESLAADCFDATSSNGRTPGCYPEDAGSSPAVAAHADETWRQRGLQPRRRGFDSFRPCSCERSGSS